MSGAHAGMIDGKKARHYIIPTCCYCLKGFSHIEFRHLASREMKKTMAPWSSHVHGWDLVGSLLRDSLPLLVPTLRVFQVPEELGVHLERSSKQGGR